MLVALALVEVVGTWLWMVLQALLLVVPLRVYISVGGWSASLVTGRENLLGFLLLYSVGMSGYHLSYVQRFLGTVPGTKSSAPHRPLHLALHRKTGPIPTTIVS